MQRKRNATRDPARDAAKRRRTRDRREAPRDGRAGSAGNSVTPHPDGACAPTRPLPPGEVGARRAPSKGRRALPAAIVRLPRRRLGLGFPHGGNSCESHALVGLGMAGACLRAPRRGGVHGGEGRARGRGGAAARGDGVRGGVSRRGRRPSGRRAVRHPRARRRRDGDRGVAHRLDHARRRVRRPQASRATQCLRPS